MMLIVCAAALSLFAGNTMADDLVIAAGGKTSAVVCVDEGAGKLEKQAADDLATFIELMIGAKPAVAATKAETDAAIASGAPVLIVGQLALATEPTLSAALDGVKKKDPTLRADAIVVRRAGHRVYVAGSNDESHYHAAVWLLTEWGCRWYLPGDIGQCIPHHDTLSLSNVDHVYAPPFEVRHFWIAWNGSYDGHVDFVHRNFMHSEGVPSGHILAKYVSDIVPEGKTHMNIPLADPKTAEHVANQLAADFAAGKKIMLGMEDGVYESDYPLDQELQAGLFDKYFLKPVLTDPFMVFYNNVARDLLKRTPDSNSKIGYLSYTNITLPPQQDITAEKPLVTYLAPIDIDPNHGMDDVDSPARQEYREMMYRWSKVMQGRVAIYDYDQGMLVWRDIPNPSHMAFRQDVKHYRDAGILGIDTESRGAMATVFTNLYLRGQLMWNPDADVDAMLEEFYVNFYGPAAKPMGQFWNALYQAWDDTLVTEHEYMAAPAIYTPELMQTLAASIDEANKAIAALEGKADRSVNEEWYVKRMAIMRLQWSVLTNYMSMVYAASEACDYARAVELGKSALAARLELSNLDARFTTRVIGPAAEPTEPSGSPAWLPGEVKQYMDLASLTDGTKGTLVKKLPLEWAFHRDPRDTGLPRGWGFKPADLGYYNANKDKYNANTLKDYPTTEWEMLATNNYPQAQGIRHPDYQSYTGHMWYKTTVTLTAEEAAGDVHVMFPGLFNECWLYVNDSMVAHRPFPDMWWFSDYKFEWDVDLKGKLNAGENEITVRCNNPHHFGGMFRRPFLYRAKAE